MGFLPVTETLYFSSDPSAYEIRVQGSHFSIPDSISCITRSSSLNYFLSFTPTAHGNNRITFCLRRISESRVIKHRIRFVPTYQHRRHDRHRRYGLFCRRETVINYKTRISCLYVSGRRIGVPAHVSSIPT